MYTQPRPQVTLYTWVGENNEDRYYGDSNEIQYDFEYHYEEESKSEEKKETKEEKQPEVVEETITITSDLLSMTKDEFEAYLNSVNIASIESSESEEVCPSDKRINIVGEGIKDGQSINVTKTTSIDAVFVLEFKADNGEEGKFETLHVEEAPISLLASDARTGATAISFEEPK